MQSDIPIMVVLLLRAISIHGASNKGEPTVKGCVDSSFGEVAGRHYRKMEANQKRLQTTLETFMDQMMEMMSENRRENQLLKARLEEMESTLENVNTSIINGRWMKWSEWSTCGTGRDDGEWTRKRTCVEPINGGRPCQGKQMETRRCKDNCPVDGRWMEWSEWSNCSARCGDGISIRTRTCEEPLNGGQPCQGNETETKLCHTKCVRNLVVLFYPRQFHLIPPYQRHGKYGRYQTFVNVNDSGLSGAPTFLEVRESLASVFLEAEEIRRMGRWYAYSKKNGEKVVKVTSVDGRIPYDSYKWNYCDADGNRFNRTDVERISWDRFREGSKNRVRITDGECRTVLVIWK